MIPVMAPRIIKPIGRAVGGRIYSDACATGEGMAAVELLPRQVSEFTVLPKGTAGRLLQGSVAETNEIPGLDAFAIVAAAVALGEQLRG